jgi:hypothetical protein
MKNPRINGDISKRFYSPIFINVEFSFFKDIYSMYIFLRKAKDFATDIENNKFLENRIQGHTLPSFSVSCNSLVDTRLSVQREQMMSSPSIQSYAASLHVL